MEITITRNEIEALLINLRLFKPEIGSYQLHVVNETFHYFIQTTNGSIVVRLDQLIANTKNELLADQLKTLAETFTPTEQTKDNTTTNKQSNTSSTQTQPTVKSKKGLRIIRKVAIILGIGLILLWLTNLLMDEYNAYKRDKWYRRMQSEAYYNDLENPEQMEQMEQPAPPTEAELREQLRQKERSKPTNYLQISYSYRFSIFKEVVMNGTIENSASQATYKDVRVRLKGYSKTKTLIETHDYNIMEIVSPNGSTEFKLRTADFWDKNVSNIELDIIGASNYD